MSTTEKSKLLSASQALESGMGAVAWATLEMFKRGGMTESDLAALQSSMNEYFAKPSNEECNTILSVLETRLREDKKSTDAWY